MRFYRLHIRRSGDESDGYMFFPDLREAKAEKRAQDQFAREEGLDASEEVECIDIVPTKAGILAALREYASHADNG